jgi:tetratricopeptide (TPR) repeat protein
MRWRVLAVAVLSICVVFAARLLMSAFFHNLGGLKLLHGLMSERIPNSSLASAQPWFAQAARAGDKQGIRSDNLSYGSELAYLATLDPLANPYHPDLNNWSHSERGQMLRKATIQLVLRRVDEAHHEGRAAEEKAWRMLAVELQPGNADQHRQLAVWLVSERGDIAEAIAQYQVAVEIDEPTYQDYLRLVALNLKVGQLERATYWHDQLRRSFPEEGYLWLHDLQDSYAQLALAEAYAYFGLLDDAISVGERSVAMNNWDWGHRVVAQFYRRQGRYPEAERHLLTAMEHPTSEAILIQYRVELADLYAEQGKIQQAVTEYCRALGDTPVVDAAGDQDNWRVRAVSCLAELTGIAESEVSSWCASR